MKLAWLTDIHLNFIVQSERIAFYNAIDPQVEAVLITGDIAEADSIEFHLEEMANHLKKPIYFVLGNHDYYRNNVQSVREQMQSLMQKNDLLFWLGGCDPISIDQKTILVGIDGWADGRNGNYQKSPVILNDSNYIDELMQARLLGPDALLRQMQTLADKDAEALTQKLVAAIGQKPKTILVATHVPPFKEVCWHEGQLTDDDYLPFFSSKATGDVLLDIAQAHDEIHYAVFAGHTHDAAALKMLPNLFVQVGSAEYYRPGVQKMIDTEVDMV